jgi:hypothetical protein
VAVDLDRRYGDWLSDAHGCGDRQLELANELRDRWNDWKADSPYKTWDECLRAELSMTAAARRERNSYRKRKAERAEKAADVEPTEESVRMPDGPESEAEIRTEPGPDSARWEPSRVESESESKPPANPAKVRERAITSACNAASRYSEALTDLSVAEYETYTAGPDRVIAEWTSVRDSLRGRVGGRIEE